VEAAEALTEAAEALTEAAEAIAEAADEVTEAPTETEAPMLVILNRQTELLTEVLTMLTTRASRADRGRRAGSVRLGSAVRNRTTDDSGRSDGSASTESPLDSEPVIRLGARKGGRPRAEVKTDNTTELKLSEMKDIISMFLDTAFELPAVMMRQDFWRLNKDENKILTDAIVTYIKSMPKNKSSWLMNFIQENLPLVNLIMVGFFVVSDRVKGSIAIAQVNRAGSKFATATSGEAPAPDNVRTPLDNMFH
jgi:hypothetical protein